MKPTQRKHLAQSLLPDTAFRHIGVMVAFMALLMTFAGSGFIAVTGVINGWTFDINNTLTIEIPAHDKQSQTVRDTSIMDQLTTQVKNALQHNPLVVSIDLYTDNDLQSRMVLAQIPQSPNNMASEFDIPLPRFMTVHLHPDRLDKSATRLEKIIQSVSPDIIVKTHEDWVKDIHDATIILRLVFSGLGISILIVTGFIITGVVRTQLKASLDTIALFHLMGAQSYTIAALFQRAVLSPVAKGALTGLLLGLTALIPISSVMHLSEFSWNIWLLEPIIFLLFMILATLTTQITVLSNLREMP